MNERGKNGGPPSLPPRMLAAWEARQVAYQREQAMLERGGSNDTKEKLLRQFPALLRRRMFNK